MRKTILATTAALIVVFAAAPGFAAEHGNGRDQAQQNDSSSINNQCENILANPSAYSPSDVAYCRGK